MSYTYYVYIYALTLLIFSQRNHTKAINFKTNNTKAINTCNPINIKVELTTASKTKIYITKATRTKSRKTTLSRTKANLIITSTSRTNTRRVLTKLTSTREGITKPPRRFRVSSSIIIAAIHDRTRMPRITCTPGMRLAKELPDPRLNKITATINANNKPRGTNKAKPYFPINSDSQTTNLTTSKTPTLAILAKIITKKEKVFFTLTFYNVFIFI